MKNKIKPDRPVNVGEHLKISFIAGFINMIMLFIYPESWRFVWGYITIGLWIVGITWVELYQAHKSKRENYWAHKWLDTICDLLAGAIPFIGMTILGMVGNRF